MSSSSFREQVRAGAYVVGTFLKTTSHQVVEVLGRSGLDFMVIDAEHAPFDRSSLDLSILAARSTGLNALVRIPDHSEATILQALDSGAMGVVIPHVKSADDARSMFLKTRYRQGVRGFSNSPRAGEYGGIGLTAHVDRSDKEVVAICQIEDREGIEAIDQIAAVEEIDGLFIGRADLALSYGLSDVNHPQIIEAVRKTCVAGKKAGKSVGIFIGDVSEAQGYMEMGITFFVVASDQSILRAQAADIASRFRATANNSPRRSSPTPGEFS
jgi:2-keto-3-deoxy-L-rhamnonate aldolase RhmA